jgi:4-amino-4-deoxy-L-arabinose transferase-like glycosyltransferase
MHNPLRHPPPVQQSWLRDRQSVRFVLVLALYFLAHLLIRLNLSDSLDLDEAEQAFEFQRLRMGYGTQPPLYNWLQWLLFSTFGLNLFALALLKSLCLFGIYFFMFLTARPLVGSMGAMAVSASMLLLPQIGWEAQRDLTHSALLTTIASMSLYAYFALLRQPTLTRYALFGLLVGLGMQTKYNFVIFTMGLVFASLVVPPHRAIVWNRKIVVSIAVAVLCLLPHGLWVLQHFDTAAGGTIEQMKDESTTDFLLNVLAGMRSLLVATISFITPIWLIYLLVCRPFFGKVNRTVRWRPSTEALFFLCLYAGYVGCIVIMVLSGEVTRVKDRWMQPMLFSAPLLFFLLLPGLAQPAVFRRIMKVAVFTAACFLIALPLRVYLGPSYEKYVRAHHPYPALASELARRYPQLKEVVATDKLLAGNLHFQRPALRAQLLPRMLEEQAALPDEGLLIMRAGEESDWQPRFQAAYPEARISAAERISLPYRYGGKEEMAFLVSPFVVPAASHR